ncbi:hypothetical protein [Candidatus Bandiella euplotis]|uniref:Pentapeptide repeat-containing N-terminal domain protein n=1 Tax=Candidatus Bandiella euplotis TaxID=1664265 RepID=A0ABZ0ULY0_9RICK|nr:hypothetical protein [Candidatus Bandiella woodruffii]WPX96512.1 Putative pentapeptide repeat-containing N-terminal domain protein [Candidatus Bandiella woodruffii]
MSDLVNNLVQKDKEEKSKKFMEYDEYARSFDGFLRTVPVFKIIDSIKTPVKAFLSLPTWGKVMLGTPVALVLGIPAAAGLVAVEATKFGLALITSPLRLFGVTLVSFQPFSYPLYKLASVIKEPEMQKLLVEKTQLLEQIGKNKEIVKGLVKLFALPADDKNSKLLRNVANAGLELLGDKKSREVLREELLNNYFKFNITPLDREKFIQNYVIYENGQLEKGLRNWLQNIANVYNDPVALRKQLIEEMVKTGFPKTKINSLLPEKIDISTAQDILIKRYEVKINALEGDAQRKLDQENQALDRFISDYLRFEKAKMQNQKSDEELTKEAVTAFLRNSPDYMRLAENVVGIIADQPDGQNDNLKGVLRGEGSNLIEYFKEVKNGQPIDQTLKNFGVTDELLDAVPILLKEPAKLESTINSIRNQALFQWAEGLMGVLSANKDLKEAFAQNPEIASEIAIGVINNVPMLKNMCEDFGCGEAVLNIIKELVKTPEKAKDILECMNDGKTELLINKVITLIGENQDLQEYLKNNGQAYASLVSAMFKKLEVLQRLNLKDEEVNLITGIIPYLLGDAKGLGDIYALRDRPFEILREINELAGTNLGLKNYLNGNADAISSLVNRVIQSTPSIKDNVDKYLSNTKIDIGKLAAALLKDVGNEEAAQLKSALVDMLGSENATLIFRLVKFIGENKDMQEALTR